MKKYRFQDRERTVLENLKTPLAVYQRIDGNIVTVVLSDGFCELFGYDDRDNAYADMDADVYSCIHSDDVARISESANRFIAEGDKYDVIYRSRRRNGAEYRIIHAVGEFVFPEKNVRLAYIWYVDAGKYGESSPAGGSGITRVLNNALRENSILNKSMYHPLSGLPRLTFFFELAEKSRKEIEDKGGSAVLVFMNLSGMKYFNTKHGFTEGDRLIKSFSEVISKYFGAENCCHISGDHFAAFTEEERLEDKLRLMFLECKMINGGNTLPVIAGIYPTSFEDVPVSVACDRAKFAADTVKKAYESVFNYYDKDLNDKETRRIYLLSSIDRAIKEKWITVYYQPLIRAVDGRVCDEEALARWIDPVSGFMSPADFIPSLEESKQIYKLDLFVLEQVLEKIKEQEEAGILPVPHSINLSRSDFDVCDIVEEIRRRVDDAGISRRMINVEITESALSDDFLFMKEQIARFRELGFAVWMDDFGKGYSSLDVLQTTQFDLLKFDMNFMKRLNEGDGVKIILTELIKMAASLGMDTVCEGVETEEQIRFLIEAGCSRFQGFYYSKPVPKETILERYKSGTLIGYENPEETEYYDSVGRVNLFDFSVFSGWDDSPGFVFNTLPMGIIEVSGDKARFARSNSSYRAFVKRYFGFDLAIEGSEFTPYSDAFMRNVVRTCCEKNIKSFFDEKMPDGTVVHSFARKVATNPVNGTVAVAVAVLSVTDPDETETYADIARALAADYLNIYAVDLDTDRYIEYSSPAGKEELAMERHGDCFFESAIHESKGRIYEEDRDAFFSIFTKENIIKELDVQGVFTATYRLVDTGHPVYANMKVTRLGPNSRRIIIGVSIVDHQMKQREEREKLIRDEFIYSRISALSGDYLSLYTIDPETSNYTEYSTTSDYETLGFEKSGDDFFFKGTEDGKRVVFPDDLSGYLASFTKENVMRKIKEDGVFQIMYRLVINGEPRQVMLKIVPVREHGVQKLIAGVRSWQNRAKERQQSN